MRWTVLIPAKALPNAKSRLAPMSADADAHRRLVEAIRADTIAAAQAAGSVARVLLVVDRMPDLSCFGAEVVVQTSPGLDAAVREGAAIAAARWPQDGIAALVGDLPALRPGELEGALDAAARHGASFVPDAAGTGTTLLAVTPGEPMHPQFGVHSARRHVESAAALEAGAGLRHDVDTADDLRDTAARVGVGLATAAVLRDLGVTAGSTCQGMISP